jgi:hypothetical protein
MSLSNASECLNRAMNALTDGREAQALACLSSARLDLEVEEIANPANRDFARSVMSYLYEARKLMSVGLPNRALECVQTAVQMLDEHLIPGVKEDIERARLEYQAEADACYEDGTDVPAMADPHTMETEPFHRYEREAERLEHLWEMRNGR